MNDAYFVLAVWVGAVLFFGFVIFRIATAKRISASDRLHQWAVQRKFRLVTFEENPSLPWKIMLPRLVSRHHTPIYRIVVKDETDQIREGWISIHDDVVLGTSSEQIWWRHADKCLTRR
jgi:hypothetical protein